MTLSEKFCTLSRILFVRQTDEKIEAAGRGGWTGGAWPDRVLNRIESAPR